MTSWLTDFAGKAENLLNQIDKNTAALVDETPLGHKDEKNDQEGSWLNTGLNSSSSQAGNGTATKSNNQRVLVENFPHIVAQGAAQVSDETVRKDGKLFSKSMAKRPNSDTELSEKPKNKQRTRKAQKEDDEKDLIEFLNEAPAASKYERKTNQNHQKKAPTTLDRSENGGQLQICKLADSIEKNGTSSSEVDAVLTENCLDKEKNCVGSDQPPACDNNISEISAAANPPTPPPQDYVQTKELMMTVESNQEQHYREEIASLTQELSQVMSRAKNTEKELSRLQIEFTDNLREAREREKVLANLQQKLCDEAELWRQQKQLFEDQVNSGRNQLRMANEKLQVVCADKDRLVVSKEEAEVRMKKCQAEMDSKSRDLDEVCKQLRTSEQASLQTIKGLEAECGRLRTLHTAITEQLGDREANLASMEAALEATRNDLDRALREHNSYKAKAQKILSEKETLIASMNESAGVPSTHHHKDPTFVKAELDHLILERDLLREEAGQLTLQLTNLKVDSAAMEKQLAIQAESMERYRAEATTALHEVNAAQSYLETQLESANKELHNLKVDMGRQKADFVGKLKEKQEEITLLQQQYNVDKKLGPLQAIIQVEEAHLPDYQHDNKKAMASLTEALLQRQAALEAANEEKTALALQLERLEKVHNTCKTKLRPYGSSSGDENSENESGRLDVIVLGKRTATMRRAYTTMDKFSVRIGATLRRYPMARIAVLIYMVFLHLWVFFILFNSASDLVHK